MSAKTKRILIIAICAAVLLPVRVIAAWIGIADHTVGSAVQPGGW